MREIVYVVDDDDLVGQSIALLLESFGIESETLHAGAELLERCPLPPATCVVSDVRMPDINGLNLLQALRDRGETAPVVLITGYADVDIAVAAFRSGADDFLRKPYSNSELVDVVQRALKRSRNLAHEAEDRRAAQDRLARLSERELEVARLLIDGMSNKEIGRVLDISYRTVEHHRKRVLEKTESQSLVELGFLIKGETNT